MTLTQKKTSNISIIVPTLNEVQNLSGLVPCAQKVQELIVVDGGSRDDTVKLAKKLGFRVIEETEPGGRGTQLNTGAANASGSILLFLHADTLLPPDFHGAICRCLQNPATILGAFQLQVKNSNLLLKVILKFANFRSKMLQLPYGDQAFFIRKQDFVKLGGFPEVPIMEDYIFAKQVKKKGRIQTLDQAVTTSARRWQRLGVIRTTLVNQVVILGYYMGIQPEKLAAFYRKK
ncbi:MAG: TIGR04283 family arsenosugar biosynthesis glycosyltransferase [Desulfocapsa sp.]|nr:TIGR04283 family arsenosugar biosynthesis glycosyltransferase [Desulfocapsa sp.]MBN4064085.1 TIGR04283 family arsenosugar biosynthesis glycosyltransferase [bacterium AH-315-I07]